MSLAIRYSLLSLALPPLAAGAARAQDRFKIDWYTIDGGGEMWGAGGVYKLGGTIGQPDAGKSMTGGTFTLTLNPGFWVPFAAVVPGPLELEPCVPDMGFGTRERSLAFNGGTVGGCEAVRVTFTDIPNSSCDGQHMWVGMPVEVGEGMRKWDSTPSVFWWATLECLPFFCDWSIYEDVYVSHQYIVANATYDLQLIPMGCQSESGFSPMLTIRTGKDVVGDLYMDPGDCCTRHAHVDCWSPPDGIVSFKDITAVADTFKGLPGALQKSRADIAPASPDRVVNFIDVSRIVDSFRGLPDPYDPPPDELCP